MKKIKHLILILCIISLVLPLFGSCVKSDPTNTPTSSVLTSKGKSSGAFFSTESKIIVYDDFTKKENLD
ncbi:MAG: hypothetical protein RR107_06030, partial [Clostridia bacterium]